MFGNAQDPQIADCAICEKNVPHTDKLVVEKEIIHKDCFKCALCGTKLQMGYCAMEQSLYNRYGPRWYCTLVCAHQPKGTKEAKLKEQGIQVRQPKNK